MTHRKLIAAGATLAIAAIGTSGALAAGSTPTKATVKAVAPKPSFKINRWVQTTLRWNKDVFQVKSGGTLHVVNDAAEEGPHTFTVVKKSDLPRTVAQLENCKICKTLAEAHGADPNTEAPPKFQFLENGVGQNTPPDVDRPGDSGVTGPGKKGESIDLKVTAKKGTTLYFMCLIHPWMQAKLQVK